MKIYSYNMGSASAKALAAGLGIKMLKHQGKPVGVDILINWGCSHVERKIVAQRVLNNSLAVGKAVNKLTAFRCLNENADINIPLFTTNLDDAQHVIEHWGPVVCRTKLNGHSGEGIVISNTVEELVDAPLYTQYIKKTLEYRVHVMHNEVFFVQRKARKMEVPNEEVNWQVRNLAGGFIYANQDVEVPQEVEQQAIDAINALGLDFGAVDIIKGVDRKYYVLEVNTACGLAGTTLDKYVEQFKRYEF